MRPGESGERKRQRKRLVVILEEDLDPGVSNFLQKNHAEVECRGEGMNGLGR